MRSNDVLEKKAWEQVNALKKEYVIDLLTAERLHDILVYLMLAQNSKNPRGIEMQQTALRRVLRNCAVIAKPLAPMVPPQVSNPNSGKYRIYC